MSTYSNAHAKAKYELSVPRKLVRDWYDWKWLFQFHNLSFSNLNLIGFFKIPKIPEFSLGMGNCAYLSELKQRAAASNLSGSNILIEMNYSDIIPVILLNVESRPI